MDFLCDTGPAVTCLSSGHDLSSFELAFTGLILSIYDKWRAGARNIGNEIIVLAVLLGNTFFFATLGTIGV